MLRQHGSASSDPRASDVDADYRLATGSRKVNQAYRLSRGRRILQKWEKRYGSITLRRAAIGALSGLMLAASVFLPFPQGAPAYAQEITVDSLRTMATYDSQSWQPDPTLSSQIGSLFKLRGQGSSGQSNTSSQGQTADNGQSAGQANTQAAPAQPAPSSPTPAPQAPARVDTSSRGGSRPTPDISTHDKFIVAVAEAAQASQLDTHVPAAVTIAQAILESDWGQSLLSTKGQNYFGIKATKGPGPAGVLNMNTWEVMGGANVTVNAGFKAYNNLYESVMDHGHFLADNARYAAAFKTSDPNEFARRIHAAGYATDPAYSTKLINLMTKFNLYQYDLPAVGQ